MTGVAILAIILIAGDLAMSVIHILLIVFVTEDTFKYLIIIGINVTISTGVPSALMPA